MLEAVILVSFLGYLAYRRVKAPEVPLKAPSPQVAPPASAPPLPPPSSTMPTGRTFVDLPAAVMMGIHVAGAQKARDSASAKKKTGYTGPFGRFYAPQTAKGNAFTQRAIQALADPSLDPAMRSWWTGVRDGVGDGSSTKIQQARANLAKMIAAKDAYSAFYYMGEIAWWLDEKPENSLPYLVAKVRAERGNEHYWYDQAINSPDFQPGMPGAIALEWN